MQDFGRLVQEAEELCFGRGGDHMIEGAGGAGEALAVMIGSLAGLAAHSRKVRGIFGGAINYQ